MEMKHELDALYKIDKAIAKLDDESKKNVINFLYKRFVEPTSYISIGTNTKNITLPSTWTENAAITCS